MAMKCERDALRRAHAQGPFEGRDGRFGRGLQLQGAQRGAVSLQAAQDSQHPGVRAHHRVEAAREIVGGRQQVLVRVRRVAEALQPFELRQLQQIRERVGI